MLPNYLDCPRKAAGQQWREEFEAAGFELRQTFKSAGALIGTASHLGGAIMLTSKRDTGSYSLEQALPIAFDKFREDFEKGVELDETTTNRFVGEIQIEKMVKELAFSFVPTIDPVLIEEKFAVDIGSGWEMEMHPDCYSSDFVIYDHKFGSQDDSYHSQLGAYSIGMRSHGHRVNDLVLNKIKRVGYKVPQPDMVQEHYDVRSCEKIAYELFSRIKADYERWDKTKDPSAFLPNNRSMNCSKKYCPLWGTDACEYGKKTKEDR